MRAPESRTGDEKNIPSGPLVGIKVLDLSTVVAAPFAAALLGDFGAEVIKVEIPGPGDHLRYLPPHKDGVSLWSKVANRNKKGITLDLRTAEGKVLVERLIAEQDVLVENFRPGTLERWGLSFERLMEINPHLIILRVTGFGQTGPYCNRTGFARIFEAMSGFAYICGSPESAPSFSGYPISDALAGVFGAFSICAALTCRNATPGRPGQEIDLSATEAMLRSLDFLAIEYDQLGVVRERTGNLNAYSAPSDVYPTRDGQWIALAVSAPPVFARFAHALERPDLLTDPRFSTNVARLSHRAEIESIVRAWFIERTEAQVSSVLSEHGVSFNRVNSIRDVFEDEHFKARDAIVSVADGDFGSVRMQNVVPRFSATPGGVWRTGPGQGEHNQEIFGSKMGLSNEEIAELQEKKVI
jgi:crotonobetainyl-CoA:carnitine CoA-transferase CaiB-like acyl-CoA transferase